MPKVGSKSFPYTKEGEQEAAAYAAGTGQEVVNDDSYGYARGGEVEGNYSPDKEFLKSFVDAIGTFESKGKAPNEEWLDVVMQVNPADYAGFSGGEDFAEEIQRIQRDYSHLDRYKEKGMQRGGHVGFGF